MYFCFWLCSHFGLQKRKEIKSSNTQNTVDCRKHEYVCCVLFCEGGRFQSVVVIGLCVRGGARVVRRVRSSHLLITVNSPVIYRRCYRPVSNGQRLWTPSTNKRADQPSDNVKQYSDRLDSPLGRPLHLSSHDLLTVPAYTSCCTISCHSHGFLHTVPLLHMKTAGLWMLWLIRHTKFVLFERWRVNARVLLC